jgi:hypothetical protein
MTTRRHASTHIDGNPLTLSEELLTATIDSDTCEPIQRLESGLLFAKYSR